jgi:hypothetical protein
MCIPGRGGRAMNPETLAREIVATPLAKQDKLRQQFLRLSLVDRLKCAAEIAACRAAKRGAIHATLG